MASGGFLLVEPDEQDKGGEDEDDGDHAAQPTKPAVRSVN